jgi:acetyl esterase/lipase
VHRDLAYVDGGHERQKLDLYLPKDRENKVPLVVFVHGGAWLAGDKGAARAALPLVSQGFAVASINYRLSQHATFPAQIHDCKAAIRYLRANADKYQLDAERIGVWGPSAGGHLAALLGTSGGVESLEGNLGHNDQSSQVQAVVDWFGPTDLVQMGGSHNRPNAPEARLLGGPVQERLAEAKSANPITYVDSSDPPFLIMHGDKDPVVPYSQSELLDAALREAKVEVELVRVAGAGHGGPQFQGRQSGSVMSQVETFFQQHLMPQSANK